LEEFGFTIEPEGSVKADTRRSGGAELKGRDVGEEIVRLTGERNEISENQETIVADLDISHLLEREKPSKAKESRRPFQVPKEEGLVHPHFN
jgi:hypothetical protein